MLTRKKNLHTLDKMMGLVFFFFLIKSSHWLNLFRVLCIIVILIL